MVKTEVVLGYRLGKKKIYIYNENKLYIYNENKLYTYIIYFYFITINIYSELL